MATKWEKTTCGEDLQAGMMRLSVREWVTQDPGNWHWYIETDGMFKGGDSVAQGAGLKSAAEAKEFVEKTAARMCRQTLSAIQRGF
jgi:hypothetical protein